RAKRGENPGATRAARRQGFGAVEPAIHARDVRQARRFEGEFRLALEVAVDAGLLARGDLRLRTLAGADKVDGIVPVRLVQAVRFLHVFVLLDFGEQRDTRLEFLDEADLCGVGGPDVLRRVRPDDDFGVRICTARGFGEAVAQVSDNGFRAELFATRAICVAL